MENIKIDFTSKFYKNCLRRRKEEAKICQDCPFRSYIEEQEKEKKEENGADENIILDMILYFNDNKDTWRQEGKNWTAYDRNKGFYRITLNEETYTYYNYCGGVDGWSEHTYKYDKNSLRRLENISSCCKRFRYIEKG